jgi:hypothetical protein
VWRRHFVRYIVRLQVWLPFETLLIFLDCDELALPLIIQIALEAIQEIVMLRIQQYVLLRFGKWVKLNDHFVLGDVLDGAHGGQACRVGDI